MPRRGYAYGYPRSRGGGFDVTDLPSLKGWYEPSDPSTINSGTPSPNDGVDTLHDKSGLNNDATQPIVVQQFTWDGSKSLVGNGSTRTLDLSTLYADLQNTTHVYFGAWVRPVSGTPAANETFFGFTNSGNFNRFLILQTSAGKLRVVVTNDTGVANNLIIRETTNAVFSSNTWTHFAVVQPVDGGGMDFYIDGSEVATTDIGGTNPDGSFNDIQTCNTSLLGAFSSSGAGVSNHFDGSFGQWVAGGGTTADDIPTDQDVFDLYADELQLYS